MIFVDLLKSYYFRGMSKIITETTPLSENDCFYIVDRYKDRFDFPIHTHKEIELNLVCNCKGCRRVVGDSVEELDYYDLTIIGGALEHAWLQGDTSPVGAIREVTVQWDKSSISAPLFEKTPFAPLKEMLSKVSHGITFGQETIKKVIPLFDQLLMPQDGFFRFQRLWDILYILSTSNDYRTLSTSSFAKIEESETSRRIKKVKDYIAGHYSETLRLDDLASMVGMTPTAFSRFFKTHTNKTLSDYIIDIRLGHAIRALIDTNMTSSEICYMCGFNNQSNFNRLFKKRKGFTPMEFREKYLKTKIII